MGPIRSLLGRSTRGDPFFSSVVLLLHCDGSNGGTTFTDSSSKNKTLTRGGSARTITSDFKYGSACIDNGGSTTSYLEKTSDSDFSFGTGDFTIEAWIKSSNSNAADCINSGTAWTQGSFAFVIAQTVSTQFGYRFRWNYDGTNLRDLIADFQGNSASPAWQHVAVVRNTADSTIKIFVNGVQQASTTSNTGTDFNKDAIRVGYSPSAGANNQWLANDRFDEIRITKGVARYTSTFAPPTAAFPDG